MDLIYVFVPPGILVITQLLLKMKGQTEAKQDIKMSSMEQLEEEKEVQMSFHPFFSRISWD